MSYGIYYSMNCIVFLYELTSEGLSNRYESQLVDGLGEDVQLLSRSRGFKHARFRVENRRRMLIWGMQWVCGSFYYKVTQLPLGARVDPDPINAALPNAEHFLHTFLPLRTSLRNMVAVCPNLLDSGTCLTADCRLNHTIFPCEPCGFILQSEASYKSHIQSRKHRSKVSGTTVLLRCSTCSRNIPRYQWEAHAGGRAHKAKLELAGPAGQADQVVEEVARDIKLPGLTYCGLCDLQVPDHLWNKHPQTVHHTRRLKFAAYKSAEDEAGRDKYGVTFAGGCDFDIVENGGGQQQLTATIDTTVPSARISIVEAKFMPMAGMRTSP